MVDNVWLVSALWLGLALAASVVSIWVGISVALIEIVVGFARRQYRWSDTGALGQLSGRFRRHPADLPRRRRDRRQSRPQELLVEHDHRGDGFLCPLSRGPAVRPIRRRLALAAGADRRHLAVDYLGRRCLRGHGRDRAQQDRDRQDHPRRLLHQRSRHGAGARPDLCQLQRLARAHLLRLRRSACGFCRGFLPGSSTRWGTG